MIEQIPLKMKTTLGLITDVFSSSFSFSHLRVQEGDEDLMDYPGYCDDDDCCY